MVFNNVALFNFKNFTTAQLDFVPGINCMVGRNGVGKTNILDALHYLSLTKSANNPVDSANINYNESSFYIKSQIRRKNSRHEVLCTVQVGKKKTFKVNQKEYDKLAEHIGFMPVVMITPNDVSLINEGNETRRRFFDSTISQTDHTYLYNLVRYQKAVKQRNALLKQFSIAMEVNQAQLDPYDHEILSLGQEIYQARVKFLESFIPLFNKLYKKLSGQHEEVVVVYESDWQKPDVEDKFRKAIKRDLALQRTTVGIHRDIYHFNIAGKPIKRFGSQGQQKSLIVALKLAQYEILKEATEVTPVLLLDDIFDKLDDERMGILLTMVCEHSFGQIFLTDARPERTMSMLQENKLAARIFTLEDGAIEKVEDYDP